MNVTIESFTEISVFQTHRALLPLPAERGDGETRDSGPLACTAAAAQPDYQEQQLPGQTGANH